MKAIVPTKFSFIKTVKKEFCLRNSRAERGQQSRQNTIIASLHPARGASIA